jgi:hypothetical protein
MTRCDALENALILVNYHAMQVSKLSDPVTTSDRWHIYMETSNELEKIYAEERMRNVRERGIGVKDNRRYRHIQRLRQLPI